MSWKRPNVNVRMKALLDILDNHPTKDGYWIDIGTGSGVFANLLGVKFSNASILTSDIRMLHESQYPFIIHSVQSPPFRRNSIDGIIVSQVLHYLKSIEKSLLNLLKTLNDNGQIVIIEYETTQSAPWIPFPLPYNKISVILNEVSDLYELPLYTEMYFGDINYRKKYSLMIKKVNS